MTFVTRVRVAMPPLSLLVEMPPASVSRCRLIGGLTVLMIEFFIATQVRHADYFDAMRLVTMMKDTARE